MLPKPPFFADTATQVLWTIRVRCSIPVAVVEQPPALRWWVKIAGLWSPPRGVYKAAQRVYVDVFPGTYPTHLRYLGSPPVVRSTDWQSLPAFEIGVT